jgi:hypothetical protein
MKINEINHVIVKNGGKKYGKISQLIIKKEAFE